MKSAQNLPLLLRSWGEGGGTFFLLAVLAAVLAICQPVRAQSKPAVDVGAVSAEDSLERQPVVPDSPGAAAKSAATSDSPPAFGATRVVLALAGVVGLILLLRGAPGVYFPAPPRSAQIPP